MKPAALVPASLSRWAAEILPPSPLGVGDLLYPLARSRIATGFSWRHAHQAENRSLTLWRRLSRSLASLIRSTGSWQPRASKGSRTHRDHCSKLPKVAAGTHSNCPQRQIVSNAESSSCLFAFTTARISIVKGRDSGIPGTGIELNGDEAAGEVL